jgi:hypothetical protein
MKAWLKFFHEVGTVGAMGAVSIQLLLSFVAAARPPAEHAVLREVMLILCRGFLLPSLVLVIVSGLLSMGLHRPFQRAEWVLVKALTTPLVFEGTVLAIDAPARGAVKHAASLAAGDLSAAGPLNELLRLERWGLVIALVLYTANIALAVWRPRLRPRVARESTSDPSTESASNHSATATQPAVEPARRT